MSIIKKSLVLVLIISMVLLPLTDIYVEADDGDLIGDLQVPIQVVASTKNGKGEKTQYFSPGDDMYLEYTITPNDILLSSLPQSKPVDIALVLDTSGSMDYISSTFLSWRDDNAVCFSSFDDYLSTLENDDVIKETYVYSSWKKTNTSSVTFDVWKENYCSQISESDWMKLYKEEFSNWFDRQRRDNVIKLMSECFTADEFYKKYITKGFIWNYECTICGNSFNNSNKAKKHYDAHKNDYIYNDNVYSENQLKQEYDELADSSVYYFYNDELKTYQQMKELYNNTKQYSINGVNDTLYTYEELQNEWEKTYKNLYSDKYLYKNNLYTDSELLNKFNNEVQKYRLYNKNNNYTSYTYSQLKSRWQSNYVNYRKDNLITSYKYGNETFYEQYYPDQYFYYNKVEYTQSELLEYWKSNVSKASRLTEAKNAMVSFVNKLCTAENAECINLCIKTFDYYGKNVYSLVQTNNIKKDKNKIIQLINSISAGGSTNGGDALRLAYHDLINAVNEEHNPNQYIIFLADGQNNVFTFDNRNQYYYGKNEYLRDVNGWYESWGKLVKTTSNKYNWNDYVYHTDENGLYRSVQDKTIPGYTRSGVEYINKVAEMIYQKGIKTYVVGVGDGTVTSEQSRENQNVCAYANYGKAKDSTTNINNLYFPVNDASKLSILYEQMAQTILSEIPINDIELDIEFKSAVQIDNIQATIQNMVDVTVDGKPYDGLTVTGNKLSGSLPEFKYTLDKENGVYKADKMVVTIHIKIPENYEESLESIEATLKYKVFDKEQSTSVPVVIAQVVDGLKPLRIEAVLNTNADGSASLSYKPIADEEDSKLTIESKSIRLKTKPDSDDEKDYVGEKYDAKNEGTIELSSADLQKFTDDIIYIETSKKIKMPDSTIKEKIGVTQVFILKNGSLEYKKNNYDSSLAREVEISFNAPSNNLELLYKSNNSTVSSIDVPIYSSGLWTKNMVLKSGSQNMTVLATNSFGNTTVYSFPVTVNCKLPVIAGKTFNSSGAEMIFTATSNQMDTAVIRVYNAANELKQTVTTVQDASNKQKFTASFAKNSISSSDTVEIDGLDIYKNGVKGKYQFASLIEFGLYNKRGERFFNEISNVVEGCRYTWGVKFIYNGQSKVKLSSDNINLKINGSNGSIKDLNTNNVLTESSNKFKMVQGESCVEIGNLNLEYGKEYLLLFDVIFSSNTDISNKNINLKLELDAESDSMPITLKELPKVE